MYREEFSLKLKEVSFFLKQSIILSHKTRYCFESYHFDKDIEVNKVKVDLISNFPPHKIV